MPNYTPNLNLEKPLQGEFYNVDVFNENANKIDEAIGNISEDSYQKPTGGIPLADVSSQITDRLDWYGNTSGTTNDMTLNIPEFVGTLKTGTVLRFKKTGTSNGGLRLNFNGNGLKNVLRSNGSAFSANNAGGIYTVVYDGTNFILQGEGGSGNALAAEILLGRTATTNNGEIVGTMPNMGSYSQVINQPTNLNLPSGFYESLNINVNYPKYNLRRRNVNLNAGDNNITYIFPVSVVSASFSNLLSVYKGGFIVNSSGSLYFKNMNTLYSDTPRTVILEEWGE